MAVTMSSVMHSDVLSSREVSSMAFHQPCSVDSPVYQQREVETPVGLEMCRTDQRSREHEVKTVVIPDLFVSFISQRPKPNPYYEVIKKESEAWMKQYETMHRLSRLRQHA